MIEPMGASAGPRKSRFDAQAEAFEEFAGFDAPIGRQIAEGVIKLAELVPGARLLEIGAGTGLIGRHFVELGVDYCGLDLSRPMLEVFRRSESAGSKHRSELIQADSDRPWPLADHSMAVLFGARVVHLLDPEHTVQEAVRVARPGAPLLIGRVQRDPNSLKSRLRQQKRLLWTRAEPATLDGAEATRRLLERFVSLGASAIEQTIVASWQGTVTAESILSTWETKASRGASRWGNVGGPGLSALRNWAQAEVGPLDQPHGFTESFVILGVRLPALSPS